MVEVGKGRSKRAPGSASVASGCAATNRCNRAFRAAVTNVLRLHKWVWGLSMPRSLNFCRTRRTAATQRPRNYEMQVQNLFLWPVAGSSPRALLRGVICRVNQLENNWIPLHPHPHAQLDAGRSRVTPARAVRKTYSSPHREPVTSQHPWPDRF